MGLTRTRPVTGESREQCVGPNLKRKYKGQRQMHQCLPPS